MLRPVVAVSAFSTFAAHALHAHPDCRAHVAAGDKRYLAAFADEVRRFYPFFPLVVARARADHRFEGYAVPAGRLVALDLHGTNHDPRGWAEPDQFRPERFLSREADPFDFIPQGGGDHAGNHRCPGEWFARAIMEATTEWLACEVEWDVPPDTDLSLDLAALPALPRDRMTISDLRPAGERARTRRARASALRAAISAKGGIRGFTMECLLGLN